MGVHAAAFQIIRGIVAKFIIALQIRYIAEIEIVPRLSRIGWGSHHHQIGTDFIVFAFFQKLGRQTPFVRRHAGEAAPAYRLPDAVLFVSKHHVDTEIVCFQRVHPSECVQRRGIKRTVRLSHESPGRVEHINFFQILRYGSVFLRKIQFHGFSFFITAGSQQTAR